MFKYHPDNVILYNGKVIPFNKFTEENPDFPITEGEFFEFRDNGELDLIINNNHFLTENPVLIAAINNLGE